MSIFIPFAPYLLLAREFTCLTCWCALAGGPSESSHKCEPLFFWHHHHWERRISKNLIYREWKDSVSPNTGVGFLSWDQFTIERTGLLSCTWHLCRSIYKTPFCFSEPSFSFGVSSSGPLSFLYTSCQHRHHRAQAKSGKWCHLIQPGFSWRPELLKNWYIGFDQNIISRKIKRSKFLTHLDWKIRYSFSKHIGVPVPVIC